MVGMSKVGYKSNPELKGSNPKPGGKFGMSSIYIGLCVRFNLMKLTSGSVLSESLCIISRTSRATVYVVILLYG